MPISPTILCKCLADDTRLRCLTLLQRQGQLCVCELTAALNLLQPKISRHLALLRQHRVLLDSREGQWVYYRVNPDLPDWAMTILTQAIIAFANEPAALQDWQRLCSFANRAQNGSCGG